MFAEHGCFGQLEVQIQKRNVRSETDKNQGGWYTKLALQKEGWTAIFGYTLRAGFP